MAAMAFVELVNFDAKLAIPKLMRGLGTSVKKCPN